MKKIILTGGGTAGHVTPNIALIQELKNNSFEILYIGSKEGIEVDITKENNIRYMPISSGKLRRYVSFKNMTDVFRILKGLREAIKIIKKEKPNVVFSKGGFVTVPVVIAAKICNIPVVIHESDITTGLANKIAIPCANVICTCFPETINNLPKTKSKITGLPIRSQLFLGDIKEGIKITGFTKKKPVVLVIGGSLGALSINILVRSAILELVKKYDVIHICGKGKVDKSIDTQGYKQFEYISEGLEHIFAMADIIISRAGANSIYEFLALKKLNILIPLSKKASRGDQILNAQSFKKQGFSYVILEENLNKKVLLDAIEYVFKHKDLYLNKMNSNGTQNGVKNVINAILEVSL